MLTGAEIFPCKAMCDPAVFLRTTWINPDVKVLKSLSAATLFFFNANVYLCSEFFCNIVSLYTYCPVLCDLIFFQIWKPEDREKMLILMSDMLVQSDRSTCVLIAKAFSPVTAELLYRWYILQSINFTPQVKQARNPLHIFNRKLISCNTMYFQSLHPNHCQFVHFSPHHFAIFLIVYCSSKFVYAFIACMPIT